MANRNPTCWSEVTCPETVTALFPGIINDDCQSCEALDGVECVLTAWGEEPPDTIVCSYKSSIVNTGPCFDFGELYSIDLGLSGHINFGFSSVTLAVSAGIDGNKIAEYEGSGSYTSQVIELTLIGPGGGSPCVFPETAFLALQ